ncbi:PREDICTED: DNA fragmentation factor subunit alpha-like [Hipposideros armiger]|uniref:DNAation factor subunit alpha-like n=1 Tax=Hipposideros armiger TaxID=186990 RepID=A0A8B7PYU6_HIPAR|nr:PREDICTED: DNA fragmentation factor subunit alpha-like [Hipposideros armiger]
MGMSRERSSETALSSQILSVLQEKAAPRLSLSSQDLEVGDNQGPCDSPGAVRLVIREDPRALAVALSWDVKKVETVQQACNQELSLRLQKVQSLRSLRNVSARRDSLPGRAA